MTNVNIISPSPKQVRDLLILGAKINALRSRISALKLKMGWE